MVMTLSHPKKLNALQGLGLWKVLVWWKKEEGWDVVGGHGPSFPCLHSCSFFVRLWPKILHGNLDLTGCQSYWAKKLTASDYGPPPYVKDIMNQTVPP